MEELASFHVMEGLEPRKASCNAFFAASGIWLTAAISCKSMGGRMGGQAQEVRQQTMVSKQMRQRGNGDRPVTTMMTMTAGQDDGRGKRSHESKHLSNPLR